MMCASVAFVIFVSWAFGAVAGDVVGPTRDAFVATQDPLGEPITSVVYLEQNWSPAQSVQFYFTEQGSRIIPYDWFLALEQADGATPFRDNQNILKYRYLPQNPDKSNPDGLPVGFVRSQGLGRNWMGMTCAACHTTEIRYGNTGYRIDGAPTHGDVQALITNLTSSLQQTWSDAAKFSRFAAAVLGTAKNTPANQLELRTQLGTLIKTRVGYNLRNFAGYFSEQAVLSPARRAMGGSTLSVPL